MDARNAPLKAYFNSACPVCEAGVRMQRQRTTSCEIEWIDVHRNPEVLEPLGLALEDVRERLHVRDAEGRTHIGVDALERLWKVSAGQRGLAWLARASGALGRALYNGFARCLYRWNLRRKRWSADEQGAAR